jgi:hypothetical protein
MRYFIFLVLFTTSICQAKAQDYEKKNWSLDGYITNMQSMMAEELDGYWTNDNLIHNRINFYWYPAKSITSGIQFRNRIFTGEIVKYTEDYGKQIRQYDGIENLSFNILDETSILFNSTIDRLWFSYEKGKFNATIGRQRINWGQTYVWNPNDIFNVYSFFDFDYIEKPGSDAIRLQYYPDWSSAAELAVSMNKDNAITAAGLYRFNVSGYDIQVMGGIFKEEDYVIGGGWAGNIGGMGFKGETSYFRSTDNFRDTTGMFMASVSAEYMFSNSLYLQFEFLYSDSPKSSISNFYEYYGGSLTVKKLSFTEYSFFTQVSYPVTPLLNATLAVMYFPKIEGYYFGPSIEYSLTDNLFFSFYIQSFSGELADNNRQNFHLGFLRTKLNF